MIILTSRLEVFVKKIYHLQVRHTSSKICFGNPKICRIICLASIKFIPLSFLLHLSPSTTENDPLRQEYDENIKLKFLIS